MFIRWNGRELEQASIWHPSERFQIYKVNWAVLFLFLESDKVILHLIKRIHESSYPRIKLSDAFFLGILNVELTPQHQPNELIINLFSVSSNPRGWLCETILLTRFHLIAQKMINFQQKYLGYFRFFHISFRKKYLSSLKWWRFGTRPQSLASWIV